MDTDKIKIDNTTTDDNNSSVVVDNKVTTDDNNILSTENSIITQPDNTVTKSDDNTTTATGDNVLIDTSSNKYKELYDEGKIMNTSTDPKTGEVTYIAPELETVDVVAKRPNFDETTGKWMKMLASPAITAAQVVFDTPTNLIGEIAQGSDADFTRAIPQELRKFYGADNQLPGRTLSDAIGSGTVDEEGIRHGNNLKEQLDNFAIDFISDPLDYIGAGLIAKGTRGMERLFKQLTTQVERNIAHTDNIINRHTINETFNKYIKPIDINDIPIDEINVPIDIDDTPVNIDDAPVNTSKPINIDDAPFNIKNTHFGIDAETEYKNTIKNKSDSHSDAVKLLPEDSSIESYIKLDNDVTKRINDEWDYIKSLKDDPDSPIWSKLDYEKLHILASNTNLSDRDFEINNLKDAIQSNIPYNIPKNSKLIDYMELQDKYDSKFGKLQDKDIERLFNLNYYKDNDLKIKETTDIASNSILNDILDNETGNLLKPIRDKLIKDNIDDIDETGISDFMSIKDKLYNIERVKGSYINIDNSNIKHLLSNVNSNTNYADLRKHTDELMDLKMDIDNLEYNIKNSHSKFTSTLIDNKIKKSTQEEIKQIISNPDKAINDVYNESGYSKYLDILNAQDDIVKKQISYNKDNYSDRLNATINNNFSINTTVDKMIDDVNTIKDNVDYLKSIPNYEHNKDVYELLKLTNSREDIKAIVDDKGVVNLSNKTFDDFEKYFSDFKVGDSELDYENRSFYKYVKDERNWSSNKEKMKIINNKYGIKYNPHEAYDADHSFVHQFNLYVGKDTDIKDAISNTETLFNKANKANSNIDYSTGLIPNDRLALTTNRRPVLVFYPNSKDIKTAYRGDSYTGNSTNKLFGSATSHTKAPQIPSNFDFSISDVIKNTYHTNEVIIRQTKNNHRLLYTGFDDELIKLTNDYNKKLDDLYGTIENTMEPNNQSKFKKFTNDEKQNIYNEIETTQAPDNTDKSVKNFKMRFPNSEMASFIGLNAAAASALAIYANKHNLELTESK